MITFFDIEYNPGNKKIVDLGYVTSNGREFHDNSFHDFIEGIKDSDFLAGHNIIQFDVRIINNYRHFEYIDTDKCIDTLLLSTLLFPNKPYHKLEKNDKSDPDDPSNPLCDSKNSQKLFQEEIYEYNLLQENKKQIYFELLRNIAGFKGFFKYVGATSDIIDLEKCIKRAYFGKICDNANIGGIIKDSPLELAYSLALASTSNIQSLFPEWVLKNYPKVEQIMIILRGTRCKQGCEYCNSHLDIKENLKRFFGYDNFRTFGDKPIQEMAVKAGMGNESLIAVFPTGGGKSLTYQLPALIRGEATRSLTVVISPLQSLMKDQVDNLGKKSITKAVALYGLLDSIQRKENIKSVRNGEACILYIAPESLRSKTIERLLLARDIARFVIDEAHCLSTWGHDFRVDYLFIGDFIKDLQNKKGKKIPISCFTATAKKDVIKDIEQYFLDKLNITMTKIISNSPRKNLSYKVFMLDSDEKKYKQLRLLLDENDCATIIYASRVKKVERIYSHLLQDNYRVSKFHGKMNNNDKQSNQDDFMNGVNRIMVATSAFGMGVDKDDVGMVIHYNISSSLENYVQEAGRAGRKDNLHAECYILYNEKDLDNNLSIFNSSKITRKEIKQVWSGIKKNTKVNPKITKSVLEIANDSGWEENTRDLETRVNIAVAALENSGYIKRSFNSPRVFADSLLCKNQQEASSKIENSNLFTDKEKETARRITSNLIGNKYRKRHSDEESEARVDYLAEILGITIKQVIGIINKLRELNIISDSKDLVCYLKGKSKSSSIILEQSSQLEKILLDEYSIPDRIYSFKELNEKAIENGTKSSIKMIRNISNYLQINNKIKLNKIGNDKIKVELCEEKNKLEEDLNQRYYISHSILKYLYSQKNNSEEENNPIMPSECELRSFCMENNGLFGKTISLNDIEDSLYYLKIIGAIKLEGGFLVIYSRINIRRLHKKNVYNKNDADYSESDYKKLGKYYERRVEQIHIVSEYARKMNENSNDAAIFVKDYFTMIYDDFLSKYFKGERRKEISRTISSAKYNSIYKDLSKQQQVIVGDKESKRIVVTAGPGSGKTKLLVHKLAAIALTEDIKLEQMLMLTFSRAAANEFKSRLVKLLGNMAYQIKIKTFHSYCFDLIGQVGSIDRAASVISDAIKIIENDEVDKFEITKTMIVVDEAQDMAEEEYKLINLILQKNEDATLIAVGDDDQNIYAFRKSSNKYLREFAKNAKVYELSTNYRSRKNLVEFSNAFVKTIKNRMKKAPISANNLENGNIIVTKHIDTDLIKPIVDQICNERLDGSTCVLTRTNDQASIVSGLLNRCGIKATLIQENSELRLFNFCEMRAFLDDISGEKKESVISEKQWENCIESFIEKNKRNPNFELLIKPLRAFDKDNPKVKYLSDFETLLKESSFDDYIGNDKFIVSTLHKSKGREFDNVYILYDEDKIDSDDEKRLLYVGMTRAKKYLSIHTRLNCFNYFGIDNYTLKNDYNDYDLPNSLTYIFNHTMINLGYFEFTQHSIEGINIDDMMNISESDKLTFKNRKILKFSKKGTKIIEKLYSQGYEIVYAKVRFKLYWYNKAKEEQLIIVLPELEFEKRRDADIS